MAGSPAAVPWSPGIDISAALLAKAAEAEIRQDDGIRYLRADAAAADWLAGAQFDAAVCSFGLSDIDDLDGTLASVARVTRAGGLAISGSWAAIQQDIAELTGIS